MKTLGAIHDERQHEPVKSAVVFGAAHIPAVVDYLTEKLGYHVENATWLTVARAPSSDPRSNVRAWRLSMMWRGWPQSFPR